MRSGLAAVHSPTLTGDPALPMRHPAGTDQAGIHCPWERHAVVPGQRAGL